MSVIEIDHLAKRFGDVRAVDDLSFAIVAGTTVAGFLGPNGSGMTTTLRTLVGLVAPTAGGATITGRPYRDLRDPLREVGALLEASAAHPARTARNHLRVLAAEARVPRSRTRRRHRDGVVCRRRFARPKHPGRAARDPGSPPSPSPRSAWRRSCSSGVT